MISIYTRLVSNRKPILVIAAVVVAVLGAKLGHPVSGGGGGGVHTDGLWDGPG